MLSVKALSVLALAGIAVAIPTPAEIGAAVEKRWSRNGYHWWSSSEEGTVTATATAVVTTWVDASTPAATVYAVPPLLPLQQPLP
jgi:hypothetical protein